MTAEKQLFYQEQPDDQNPLNRYSLDDLIAQVETLKEENYQLRQNRDELELALTREQKYARRLQIVIGAIRKSPGGISRTGRFLEGLCRIPVIGGIFDEPLRRKFRKDLELMELKRQVRSEHKHRK